MLVYLAYLTDICYNTMSGLGTGRIDISRIRHRSSRFNQDLTYFSCLKGIGTPVEKITQSVDVFFTVRLIVSLIVYQHVNYFFDIPLSIHAAR